MKKDYFKFFANCIITKGYTKSIISDLQREKSEFIPNSLFEIIERLNKKESITSLLKEYGKENEEILREYLDFLIQEEFGFYCDRNEFEMFPVLDLKYQSPQPISNIIIEIKKERVPFLKEIIKQVEAIGCKDVALIFYESLEDDTLFNVKTSFDNTIIKSVEVIFQYSNIVSENFLQEISTKFERLTSLFIFNSPSETEIKRKNRIACDVIFSKKKYTNFSFCGGVSFEYFNTNLPKVLEAINHNSCLHKKIAIDINGNIKNCPSMPQSFGNIKDTSLDKASNHKKFKQYWDITKDDIETCKNCEFRYICTDCRAYTERTHINKNLDLSKPLKCGYDPYTGEWEEWSTNHLKQKPINYYRVQKIIPKIE